MTPGGQGVYFGAVRTGSGWFLRRGTYFAYLDALREAERTADWHSSPDFDTGMDEGSAGSLTGRCLIVNVFLSDPESGWSGEEVSRVLEMLGEGTAFLNASAAAEGVELSLTCTGEADSLYFRTETVLPSDYMDFGWTGGIFDGGLEPFVRRSVDIDAYDGYCVMLHVNKQGRSYALSCNSAYYDYRLYAAERCVMYYTGRRYLRIRAEREHVYARDAPPVRCGGSLCAVSCGGRGQTHRSLLSRRADAVCADGHTGNLAVAVHDVPHRLAQSARQTVCGFCGLNSESKNGCARRGRTEVERRMETQPVYRRVLVKLSGEALGGTDGIFDNARLEEICAQLKRIADLGTEVAVVIGAGNIWRGARQAGLHIDRVRGDHMGMLATVINSLAVQDYLLKAGLETEVLSAIPMAQVCGVYDQYKADALLRAGKAVIIACGVGYPYFSTDTGMVLRAAELKADAVLSAKAVDYVYDKDPKKYPDAKRYEALTYAELIEKNLQVIDGTAGAFARDNNLRILLFSLAEPENLYKAASGGRVGTVITN